ncbi:uncharacterized protein [Diadema setosum]|uniref:uncharacterized protein n=1 Tax=Diadema setosum TaxID=31175 RepID=UPI003B3B1E90
MPSVREYLCGHICGKIILDIACLLTLSAQNAFLDLFIIHHSSEEGFSQGYVWVILDTFVTLFWLVCFILPFLGIRPKTQLPRSPNGNIWGELLYAYSSWLLFAPLQVAKILSLYNAVPTPSESRWAFTGEMLRIALSLTGIVFVLFVHCHDSNVDNMKYRLRMRSIGGVIALSILDGSDILSMLHEEGSSGEYPRPLRNAIMVFGSAWFILPLVPLFALRVMVAEMEVGKLNEQESDEEPKDDVQMTDVDLGVTPTTPQDPSRRRAKSLNEGQLDNDTSQEKNDVSDGELKSGRRYRSYTSLNSQEASSTEAKSQSSRLSQSLDLSHMNDNQNCNADLTTSEKSHANSTKRKDEGDGFLPMEIDTDADAEDGDQGKKKEKRKKHDHVTRESMRHSKSAIFNILLLRNDIMVCVFDIPFLAIRLHLWRIHDVSASVFLTKNILMVVSLILEIFHEPPNYGRKKPRRGLWRLGKSD